jgi:hypothetical protein
MYTYMYQYILVNNICICVFIYTYINIIYIYIDIRHPGLNGSHTRQWLGTISAMHYSSMASTRFCSSPCLHTQFMTL